MGIKLSKLNISTLLTGVQTSGRFMGIINQETMLIAQGAERFYSVPIWIGKEFSLRENLFQLLQFQQVRQLQVVLLRSINAHTRIR